MKEIWKPIRNYNNYEVSNLGNVRNKEKISLYKEKIKQLR